MTVMSRFSATHYSKPSAPSALPRPTTMSLETPDNGSEKFDYRSPFSSLQVNPGKRDQLFAAAVTKVESAPIASAVQSSSLRIRDQQESIQVVGILDEVGLDSGLTNDVLGTKESTVVVQAKPTKATTPTLVKLNMAVQMPVHRPASIQTYTQILSKSYELHEYPIPRFFIVLPKSTRGKDTVVKSFSDKFRLYFVCECGIHTSEEGSIHVSHVGYDINKPATFFKKFGLYVLAMMQMIRSRASEVGFVTPQQEPLRLAEGAGINQEQLYYTEEAFSGLIDQMISFIELKTMPANEVIVPQQSREIETLQGVGLVQLKTFLNESDKGQAALGSLYRIVTEKGHVKWVCLRHFLTTHRVSARTKLLKFVVASGSEFNMTLGLLKISLRNRNQAKEFYATLGEAQAVHALTIQLKWSVTMDDLKKFSEAILKSPIIDLCFDGDAFSRSMSDIFNLRRRYDPLVHLMVEGHIQMIKFENFRGFFGHISDSGVSVSQSIPTLRVLDLCLNTDDKHRSQILGLVKNCTGLRRLRMRSSEEMDDPTIACVKACPSLEELEILCDSTTTILHLMDSIVPVKMRRDDNLLNLRSLLIEKPACSALTTFSKDGTPVIDVTSTDDRSWQKIFMTYGWAMEKSWAPTVPAAGRKQL
ncbi:hypothetical protein BGZ83_006732 [Gryganskiella cystojenkinii]|nr:hypothetical protein BGZ83_006732 [Gryganskiella cystojenkinii]